MSLFDPLAAQDVGPSYYAEPKYHYLNRTARPPFRRVRQLLDHWFEMFPEFDTREWRQTFRSDDDRHHVGALFELYCRAILDGQGFSIIRDPDLPGKRTHPEFLVCRDADPKFVLECTLATGPDFGGPKQRRINRVYDALNSLRATDFFVGVQVEASGSGDLPGRHLRSWLESRLDTLDPEEVSLQYQTGGLAAVPHWRYCKQDWVVVLHPIPRSPESRGIPGIRPLGMLSTEVRWLDSSRPLLDALRRKASRYGRPPVAFVVALNALDVFVNEHDYADALLGSRVWDVDVRLGTSKERRQRDGFWTGPSGPHRRVSAVLFTRRTVAHTIVRETPVLWLNPWAELPFPSDLWQGPQMLPDPVSGTLVLREGRSAADILGLDPDWPGWQDDPDDDDV